MKLPRLDLESKLLLLATGACIWAPVRLIYVRGLTNPEDLLLLICLAAMLASWSEENGRHAVARRAVMSICFGMAAAVTLIAHMDVIAVMGWGAISVMFAVSAIKMFRKTRRERTFSPQATIPPTGSFSLPMMVVRDMVVIPGMRTQFMAGRESSVRALEYAKTNNSNLFLATQHDDAVFDPKASEISKFGCICKVLESIETSDGHFKVLVEGIEMAKAFTTDDSKGFFFATVQGLDIRGEDAPNTAGSPYAVKA